MNAGVKIGGLALEIASVTVAATGAEFQARPRLEAPNTEPALPNFRGAATFCDRDHPDRPFHCPELIRRRICLFSTIPEPNLLSFPGSGVGICRPRIPAI